jgi:nitrous oxide reductase accessory protein NosL
MIKIIIGLLLVSGLAFSYEMDFNKDTVGLVRHLKVYKYPEWVSKIELTNGKIIFFSSPKSMFEFYFRPAKWFDMGVKKEGDFKDIIVTDFNTLKPINAKGAFFVYGTNEISPGGDDLVAFGSYAEAQKFSKAHRGQRILSFKEVSDGLIRLLNGRI